MTVALDCGGVQHLMSPDAAAVEIALIGIDAALSVWPASWTVDPHGTGRNPHVWQSGEGWCDRCACGLRLIRADAGVYQMRIERPAYPILHDVTGIAILNRRPVYVIEDGQPGQALSIVVVDSALHGCAYVEVGPVQFGPNEKVTRPPTQAFAMSAVGQRLDLRWGLGRFGWVSAWQVVGRTRVGAASLVGYVSMLAGADVRAGDMVALDGSGRLVYRALGEPHGLPYRITADAYASTAIEVDAYYTTSSHWSPPHNGRTRSKTPAKRRKQRRGWA